MELINQDLEDTLKKEEEEREVEVGGMRCEIQTLETSNQSLHHTIHSMTSEANQLKASHQSEIHQLEERFELEKKEREQENEKLCDEIKYQELQMKSYQHLLADREETIQVNLYFSFEMDYDN